MIRILINNEEVVCDKNITITEEMLSTSSAILNGCFPKSWLDNRNFIDFYIPKDYSKCLIYKDDKLIFSGVVKNTGNIELNPRKSHFATLQILDFKTFLSEGETLDFVISNKTVEEAIDRVIETISSYGFIKGNIEIDEKNQLIGAYNTQNQTAYDVFQYLSEITQSRWFTRMIDENTVAIDFYDTDKLPKKDDFIYSQDTFEKDSIIDLTYTRNSNDYRNKQVMISNDVYASIDTIERKYSNGYSTTYTLQNNIASISSITVNGINQTIASTDEQALGIEADFYYKIGSNQIESATQIIAGQVIEITYISYVPGRQIVYNNGEVARVKDQTNRKGVIARYESRNDVLSSDELNSIGKSYIQYKSKPEIILKLQTEDKDLYSIGDRVEFKSMPLSDLNDEYMVKKIEIKSIIVNNYEKIFYTYELTNSFNYEDAVNFFDNQRRKATGNIKAGDFIDRNIDIENSVTLYFANPSIKKDTDLSNQVNGLQWEIQHIL